MAANSVGEPQGSVQVVLDLGQSLTGELLRSGSLLSALIVAASTIAQNGATAEGRSGRSWNSLRGLKDYYTYRL